MTLTLADGSKRSGQVLEISGSKAVVQVRMNTPPIGQCIYVCCVLTLAIGRCVHFEAGTSCPHCRDVSFVHVSLARAVDTVLIREVPLSEIPLLSGCTCCIPESNCTC